MASEESGTDVRPRRRMTAHEIADSTFIKLSVPLVMSLMLPVVSWAGSKILDRMDRIESAIAMSSTLAATNELRLRSAEQFNAAISADMRALQTQIAELRVKAELLEQRARDDRRNVR